MILPEEHDISAVILRLVILAVYVRIVRSNIC